MAQRKVLTLITLLVIVFALIGILLVEFYGLDNTDSIINANETKLPEQAVYKEVMAENTVPVKRQIVTDRFTEDIDQDGVIVVVDASHAYFVKKGAVIVDDNIIKVTEEEYTVDFTENPRRIVSSN